MKKAGILCALILLFVGFIFVLGGKNSNKGESPTKSNTSTSRVQSVGEKRSYIFVPYWTLDSDLANTPYDTLIYFGIAANKNGVNIDDDGYKNVVRFNSYAGTKQKLLTVRMMSTSENNQILQDQKIQEKIIQESVGIAKENGFMGIVLDFEMQGLPFESLIANISDFNSRFAKYTKTNGLAFSTLLFGDNYFRIRPYNVGAIGEVSDRVFVMSYDFHKARGNPGPTFPFDSKTEYGYDFKTMVSDFTKEIDRKKLTIVFGMFGYDWVIDADGKSKDMGVSKTTLQFERLLVRCTGNGTCTESTTNSGTNIKYTEKGAMHTVWFETRDSARKKIDYLETQGINSVAWWAYSFF